MAIPIKYSLTAQPNAIRAGNFSIGVSREGFGPSAVSNYYNGRTPNAGGYTVFGSTGGTASCTIDSATGDSGLIDLANQYGAGGVSGVTGALSFFNAQSLVSSPGLALVCTNIDYPKIVTSGMILNLDVGYTPSYPKAGTAWNNISGIGATGTLTNSPTYTSDIGGSIVFNGTNQFANGDIPSISGSAFTLAVWVKPIVTPSGGTFLSIGSSATVYNTAYLSFPSDSTVKYATPTDNFTTTIPSVTGNWNYIVATLTTSRTLSIYCNGFLSSVTTMGGLFTGNTNFTVGAYNVGSKVLYINASIPNVQVYNRVLSTAEVLQNWYAGLQRFIPTDSMAAWIDGNNTNTRIITPLIANDMSGNGNNGALNNSLGLSTDGGTSFVFNGSNQYISIIRTIQDDFTLSCWIKTTQNTGTITQWYNGMGILDSSVSVGSNDFGLSMGAGKLLFGIGNASTTIATTSTYNDNVWHYVVCTRVKSTGAIAMYVDGVSTPVATGTGNTNSLTAATNMRIGSLQTNVNFFNGNITQAMIYSRALTTTEISTIYTATKSRYGL